MDNNQADTWLARDGDGRILEVDAAGYPGAEADPGDGRPVAEAADPGSDREAWLESYRSTVADLQRRNREYLAAARAEYADRTARLGPCGPSWGAAERDWEAEAG